MYTEPSATKRGLSRWLSHGLLPAILGSHPEFVVTVETVDKESQMPISGAHVVMHPYRAVTDERGVAHAGGVAKGAY